MSHYCSPTNIIVCIQCIHKSINERKAQMLLKCGTMFQTRTMYIRLTENRVNNVSNSGSDFGKIEMWTDVLNILDRCYNIVKLPKKYVVFCECSPCSRLNIIMFLSVLEENGHRFTYIVTDFINSAS